MTYPWIAQYGIVRWLSGWPVTSSPEPLFALIGRNGRGQVNGAQPNNAKNGTAPRAPEVLSEFSGSEEIGRKVLFRGGRRGATSNIVRPFMSSR
jgi:hypothetical protein